jgi:hypothetical protein
MRVLIAGFCSHLRSTSLDKVLAARTAYHWTIQTSESVLGLLGIV